MHLRATDYEFTAIDILRLSGADNSTSVYAWKRADSYLYVGCTGMGLKRVFNHNIIGKAEPMKPEDILQVWRFEQYEDAAAFEADLIRIFKPKYNIGFSAVSLMNLPRGQVSCLACGVEFLQKRGWQRFCSKSCREGRNTRLSVTST